MGNVPLATPSVPLGVIEEDESITLTLNPVNGASSYVIHYGEANQSDPHAATFMGYSEGETWNLSKEDVPAHISGDKINFYIQAYKEKGVGTNDIEKAAYLHDGNFTGSAWSKPYIAEFE
ncbi:fibronectin type III domain-containing protein [Lactococcus formosensis]|nr:fibronectin type III domain-containing protein [Lactococcus formosensis]MCO7180449.1 fibronectin type III domain-containing protein [Lactococcus formosensis]